MNKTSSMVTPFSLGFLLATSLFLASHVYGPAVYSLVYKTQGTCGCDEGQACSCKVGACTCGKDCECPGTTRCKEFCPNCPKKPGDLKN